MDTNIDGVLLLSCDQPRLTADRTFVIARFEDEFAPTIIASTYGELRCSRNISARVSRAACARRR
jgi:hypothetical protein